MLSVFVVSAVVHEYALTLGFGFFYPVMFFLFAIIGGESRTSDHCLKSWSEPDVADGMCANPLAYNCCYSNICAVHTARICFLNRH